VCRKQAEQPAWRMPVEHNCVRPGCGGHSEATSWFEGLGNDCAASAPRGDCCSSAERVWREDYHQRDSPSSRVHAIAQSMTSLFGSRPHPPGWSFGSVTRSAFDHFGS
jgi:hypothetical protein